ncbi:MAG: hypothetical protein Q9182_006527 [Xanthomendoza sp. 2 TL-2023]
MRNPSHHKPCGDILSDVRYDAERSVPNQPMPRHLTIDIDSESVAFDDVETVESVVDLRADEDMGRVGALQEIRELEVCEKIDWDPKATMENKSFPTTAAAYPDVEWISIRDRAIQAGLQSSKNSSFYQTWLAVATGDLERFEHWKREIERVLPPTLSPLRA